MTANNTNKKAPSARRKLIPATAMLLASALALSSSTYAWFTMSREVEVQNIQMTATVPEDIQISLGKLSTAANSGNGLVNNKGTLVATSGTASDGNVDAPGNTAEYWSNAADISNYYSIGKLIPASSNTGENIFFTPDANGVGKTVKSDAKYYTAATNKTASKEDRTGAADTDTYKATLHAFTTEGGDTWANSTYKTAAGWNDTKDDGYYTDIPVWLRTSASTGAEISVKAYVVPKTSPTTTDKLYKAVRVAILDKDSKQITYDSKAIGELPVADGLDSSIASGASKYTGSSVLNWYNRTGQTGAVSAVASNVASYTAATVYGANTKIAKLAAPGTGASYGDATQFIIRVWLEGEDPDCWNETAGQDWSINLCFNNETTNPGAGGTEQAAVGGGSSGGGSVTPTAYEVKKDDTYTFTFPSGSDPASIVYTYSGTAWETTATALPAGTWKIGETAIADVAALATYITNHAPTSATTSVSVTAVQ